MIDALALTVALAAPQQDQWSHLFDHGDRWPGCSVTFTSNTGGKPLLRAIRYVKRVSGVRLVPVTHGGQLTVRRTRDRAPDRRMGEALSFPAPGTTRYASGFVTLYWDVRYRSEPLRDVWLHELGHALGLGHTLPYTLTPGDVKIGLRALYPECK